MTLVRQSLGELPIVDDELRMAAGQDGESDANKDSEMKAQVCYECHQFMIFLEVLKAATVLKNHSYSNCHLYWLLKI